MARILNSVSYCFARPNHAIAHIEVDCPTPVAGSSNFHFQGTGSEFTSPTDESLWDNVGSIAFGPAYWLARYAAGIAEMSIIDEPSHGSVELSGDGSFTYTCSPLFEGDVSFKYEIFDIGFGGSNEGTVTLHVDRPSP